MLSWLVGCDQPPAPSLALATPIAATTADLTRIEATAIPPSGPGPAISNLRDNLADYPDTAVPRYDKLELTFQVDSQAANFQWPYDPAPPPGIPAGDGVSVDAWFSPDNWQTVYRQPAFFYQEFQRELYEENEWLYPTAVYAWKVRFSPTETGEWQYRLTAIDATGLYETESVPFTVAPSTNTGFLRVSPSDSRYFAFSDGTYFPALGYNLNLTQNLAELPVMAENGIQLVRTWLTNWSIFGSAWSPWRSIGPQPAVSEPNARLAHDGAPPQNSQPPIAVPGSDVALWLSYNDHVYDNGIQWEMVPCALYEWQAPSLAVKPNTAYRVRVRYQAQGLSGPRVAHQPYGFTVKRGGWPWGETADQRCDAPGYGTILAASYPEATQSTTSPDPDYPGWTILAGHFMTGERPFLEHFYLALENVTAGHVFVDEVWIEEELDDGQSGPNLISRPRMAHHQSFDQRRAWQFDQALAAAEAAGVYLKLVVMEKNDYVLNIFEADGSLSPIAPDGNPARLILGNGREPDGKTKTRWLQEAWWRYLQARWGYSPHVHSWELFNEGDPADARFYVLADEFGAYMHQFTPNDHLVTTSFWEGFPAAEFWGNAAYPHVDYADFHRYIQRADATFSDAVAATEIVNKRFGAQAEGAVGKPVMRGETGFVEQDTGPPILDLLADRDGVWLHHFIWSGIHPGGVMESYWYVNEHIVRTQGGQQFDHRPQFGAYYRFIHDVPLANGRYQDAAAIVSDPALRAWGQKDLVAGQAHLWLQNSNHTWRQVLEQAAILPVSGTVTVTGFQPNGRYTLEWWDTYATDPTQHLVGTETAVADPTGTLTLTITNLATDTAVKIRPAE